MLDANAVPCALHRRPLQKARSSKKAPNQKGSVRPAKQTAAVSGGQMTGTIAAETAAETATETGKGTGSALEIANAAGMEVGSQVSGTIAETETEIGRVTTNATGMDGAAGTTAAAMQATRHEVGATGDGAGAGPR